MLLDEPESDFDGDFDDDPESLVLLEESPDVELELEESPDFSLDESDFSDLSALSDFSPLAVTVDEDPPLLSVL